VYQCSDILYRSVSSAAGGPSFGNYGNNPTFQLILPYSTDLKYVVPLKTPIHNTQFLPTFILPSRIHLRTTMSRRQPSPTNIALFSKSTDSTTPCGILGEEVLSSGPYSDSIYGVSTPRKRIGTGTYILVPSTHSPGLTGDFEITIWSQRKVKLRS